MLITSPTPLPLHYQAITKPPWWWWWWLCVCTGQVSATRSAVQISSSSPAPQGTTSTERQKQPYHETPSDADDYTHRARRLPNRESTTFIIYYIVLYIFIQSFHAFIHTRMTRSRIKTELGLMRMPAIQRVLSSCFMARRSDGMAWNGVPSDELFCSRC